MTSARDDLPATQLAPEAAPTSSAHRDLVQAFRLNAEALHRLEALQTEVARALQRGDRSELMLQSTQALNETFRGLATIQRTLLERLDAGAARPRSRLLPLAALGFLLVLVGGIAALVEAIRQGRSAERIDATEIAREVRTSFLAGHQEGQAARERELTHLHAEADAARQRSQEVSLLLDAKLDELAMAQRAVRSLELEKDDYAERVARGQQAAVAKELLAQEVERLERERLAHDAVVARLEGEITRLRGTTTDLRQRIADQGLGLPRAAGDELVPLGPTPGVPNLLVNEPAPSPASPTVEEAIELPEDPWTPSPDATPLPGAVPPEAEVPARRREEAMPPPLVRRRDEAPPAGLAPSNVVASDPPTAPARDPLRLQRVQGLLNGLLDAARAPGRGSFTVTGIEGIRAQGLEGLALVRYDPQDRPDDLFRAATAEIVLDRAAGQVALILRDGTRRTTTGRMPLPAPGLKIVVARSPDLVEAWSRAGLDFVIER